MTVNPLKYESNIIHIGYLVLIIHDVDLAEAGQGEEPFNLGDNWLVMHGCVIAEQQPPGDL